jgi:hypothetical protein
MASSKVIASSLALAALFRSTTATSQLCQVNSNYESSNIFAQYCYKSYSDEASASAVCDAIDVSPPLSQCLTLTFDEGATYTCYCKTWDLDYDCPISDPDMMMQMTCTEGEDEWDYTADGYTSETFCENSSGEMANYANNCCSDGYSVCEDYASQLCSDTSRTGDYQPTNLHREICYEVYDDVDNGADATALCADTCYVGLSDLTGDGVDDYYCVCYDFATSPDSDLDACAPLADSTYESTTQIYNCAADANDYWAYDDATTACADTTTASELVGYADVCCASGQSVCEEGYCVSYDSTVSTLVNIDDKRRTEIVQVSQLKVGDEILSMHKNSKIPQYSKVEHIGKSPSSGDFFEVKMMRETKPEHDSKVRATSHHTFPSCDGKKDIRAFEMKKGDCLLNSFGEKQLVKSVTKQAINPEEDFTYTLKMQNTDVIFVGDVATHSQKLPIKHDKMKSHPSKRFNYAGSSFRGAKKATSNKKVEETKEESFEKLMKQKISKEEQQKINARETILKVLASKK